LVPLPDLPEKLRKYMKHPNEDIQEFPTLPPSTKMKADEIGFRASVPYL
jgi:hypothetical protein